MMDQASNEFGTQTPTSPRSSRRGFLIAFGTVLVVLSVVVAGALGFWLGSSDKTAAPPPEIEELIVEYRTAIGGEGSASFDRDAFLAVVTEGFRVIEHMYQEFGGVVMQTGTLVMPADEYYVGAPGHYQQEEVSLVVAGSGPWFVSTSGDYADSRGRFEGIATFVVVEEGGTLKVADWYWIGRSIDLEQ